jgi:hypothetical protein
MTVGIAQVFTRGTYMPKEYSVKHIQILRLAYFAELRYLLTFSGGKTDASLRLKFSDHFMERG